MGEMHCPKMSVTNYRPTQQTIPDEQNVSIKVLQLVRSGKKKSFGLNYSFFFEIMLHYWVFCS